MGKDDSIKTDIAVIKSKLINIETLLTKYDDRVYRLECRQEATEKDIIGVKSDVGIKTIALTVLNFAIGAVVTMFKK